MGPSVWKVLVSSPRLRQTSCPVAEYPQLRLQNCQGTADVSIITAELAVTLPAKPVSRQQGLTHQPLSVGPACRTLHCDEGLLVQSWTPALARTIQTLDIVFLLSR